jgi:glutathionylspermidine synthase
VEVNLTNESLKVNFEYDASASDLLSYKIRRERFYLDCLSLWPGTLLDCNDLLDAYALPSREIAAITQAAAAIDRIYQRTAKLLRTVPDDVLLQMGLSPETVNISRLQIPGMPNTVIGRLDFVKTADGYRMLEFNADNPGLLIETFPINAKVCKESGKIDPNQQGEAALIEALQEAISAGLAYVGKTRGKRANMVFTCRSTYLRDLDITQYLMGLIDLPGGIQKQYVPIEFLRADEQGLYDPNGNQIDVLYRFHPLQFFCGSMFRNHGDDTAGMYDGALLYDLVLKHKLAIINPPSALMIENKAVQAVIWGLSETESYFTPQERCLIQQHFLPTYMDPVFCDEPYVVKPVYGSEGDTVTIIDPKKGDLFRTNTSTYLDQPMVYQKYEELPRVELMTEHGMQSLSLLTSCFLINGEPVGITVRAGEAVTDYSWRSVPVCVS